MSTPGRYDEQGADESRFDQLEPYQMGTNDLADQYMARQIVQPNEDGTQADLVHRFGDDLRYPESGMYPAVVQTWNDDRDMRPISATPDWDIAALAHSVQNSRQLYPLVDSGPAHAEYTVKGEEYVAALASQDTVVKAYGDLDYINGVITNEFNHGTMNPESHRQRAMIVAANEAVESAAYAFHREVGMMAGRQARAEERIARETSRSDAAIMQAGGRKRDKNKRDTPSPKEQPRKYRGVADSSSTGRSHGSSSRGGRK